MKITRCRVLYTRISPILVKKALKLLFENYTE